MADSYVKEIKLKFKADKSDVNKLEDELKKISKSVNLDESAKESLATSKKIVEELKKVKELYESFRGIDTKEAKAIREELQTQIDQYNEALGIKKKGKDSEIGKDFLKGLESISKKFIDKLGSIFTDAWEELNNILSYSRLSNSGTRDLAFTYGFSASQAYGYSQAMNALGFSSEEDLFYANTQEIELFKNAFQKYSDKYQKLYDEGTFSKLLEFQVEMNEFQQDLKLEVVDFFMQNKDTIKAALGAIMEIADALLTVTSWLLGTDQVNARSAAVSEVVSNYSNQKVTNVSIDNTFNGIDASQRQNLTRLGTMTTQQLIAALK